MPCKDLGAGRTGRLEGRENRKYALFHSENWDTGVGAGKKADV